MTKREQVIVGIMCLTVAFGAYDLFVKGSGSRRPTTAAPQEQPLEEVQRFAAEMSRKAAGQRISEPMQHLIQQASAEWSKDPFLVTAEPLAAQPPSARPTGQPPRAVLPAVPEYNYSGFLQVGGTRLAIINGMEYAQGEVLGTEGYFVRSITEQRVVIEHVNGIDTIQLPLRED